MAELPGFLERCCLGVFAAKRVLLLAVLFFLPAESAFCKFVACEPFLLLPDWFVSELVVPERTDTTVPTAVPTFCATSVKTLGSAVLDLLFEPPLAFVGIRCPPQFRNFDASSMSQVAYPGCSKRQID